MVNVAGLERASRPQRHSHLGQRSHRWTDTCFSFDVRGDPRLSGRIVGCLCLMVRALFERRH